MYNIAADLPSLPAITATILCTIIIFYTISVYCYHCYYFVYNNNSLYISVSYFCIMVAEKGWVTERGHTQIFLTFRIL